MSSYSFNKEINSDDLTLKIQQSSIITALDYIETDNSNVIIYFKANLSSDDLITLNNIIDNYILPSTQPSNVEVTTQYEKNDKDLKLACGISLVDNSTGKATVLIPIPGSLENGDGRFIAGATAFFDVVDAGDKVNSVSVVDVDNVLGGGVNTVIKEYSDSEQLEENQGWYIPPKRGQAEVEAIGGYGFIPSQLYLKVEAEKVSTNKTGTFYLNLFWGKKS